MAGSTIFTKTLDRVVAVAGAVSGLTGRAFGGQKRFTEAENLNNMVRALTAGTQGYFFASIQEIEQGEDLPYPFVIRGLLLIYVPKQSSNDLNDVWDLAATLGAALSDRQNFEVADATVAMPSSAKCKLAKIEDEIAYIDFGHFGGGAITFDDP